MAILGGSNKIPVIVISSVIVIAFVVSAFTQRQVEETRERIVEEKMRGLEAIASRLELRFQGAAAVLELAAMQPQVRNDVDASLISEELKGIPENADLEMRSLARDIINTHSDFEYVFFAMPNGDIYMLEPYSEQAALSQLNFAFRDWFTGATSITSTYVSEAYISSNTKHEVVAIAVPVYSGTELKGLWVGALDLAAVQEKLREGQLGENEFIIITDHKGNLVADSRQTQLALSLESYTGIEGVNRALSGDRGAYNQMMDGSEMFVSYIPFSIGTHTWALASVQPDADAFSTIDGISLQSNITITLLVIISAVAGFFLYRSFKSNASLINRLEEANQDLKVQADRLREVDKEKEEFSAMITHELKTPLVPIIGFSEILMDGTLGELSSKQREKVQVIHESATSLTRLISDLLDVRKLELNQMRFDKIEVSANQIIEQSVKSLEHTAKKKGITITYPTPDNGSATLMVKCDPKRIQQVMHNLLTNAIKFSPGQSRQIEVSAREVSDSFVEFSVKDNGVGIPKDKQHNLFKKFYQVDTSLSRNVGGTGLGLAICKGIVEAHGGKIHFESEPDAGATFYFTVPSHKEVAVTAATSTKEAGRD